MNNNKVLTFFLVIIVGVITGFSILVSILKAVNVATSPFGKKLNEIALTQRSIEQKLSAQASAPAPSPSVDNNDQTAQLLKRIDMMERRIAVLEQRKAGNDNDNAPAFQQPPQEDYGKAYDIPVGQSYVHGKKDAPVTIVEFMDFQCPFCGRFHPPVAEILKVYPDDVSYIIKNFPLPFHPQARPAAKAALAAGEQGKYFEMADKLLENQQALNEDKFKEIAKGIGLNVDKFMKDYKDKDAEWEKRIQADMELMQKVDVRGTPTFFINGHKTMARDTNSFKAEIDKILKEKKK